jgi:alkylation response protein AidB-like acyl-CoA dehydrogenase
MELTLTQEQEELRDNLRHFLAAKSPTTEVRRLMDTGHGYDPSVWTQMARQLGLQGLAIPEEYGGSGFGLAEQLIVLEEAGRSLLAAPYLSAVIASTALLVSGDDTAKKDLLPGIAEGTSLVTVADAEGEGLADPSTYRTRAERAGEGHRVTGTKHYVLDGHVADVLLVVALTPDGPGLFAVDGGAPGVQRRLSSTLDATRKLAVVDFDGAPARLVGEAGARADVLDTVRAVAVLCLAAEQTGGAARCLEMAVDYARTREQFGRPIGSFQAIKHKLADVALEVEAARSAVAYGSWALVGDRAELGIAAAVAGVTCSQAYVRAAQENIQVHGGIGFTWEHDAHLFLRRAKSSSVLFGRGHEHRERLAQLVGI